MDQADATGDALSQKVNGPGEGQPEDLSSLCAAIQRLEQVLPGWRWSVSTRHVPTDASVGQISRPWAYAFVWPDVHGPSEHVVDVFYDGFDCGLRQPASCADALNGAIDKALAAHAADRLNQPSPLEGE